jgi:hypothetical protein
LGQAILFLAQRGVDAQRAAEQGVRSAHERLLSESSGSPEHTDARNDLIRAIFGPDAIATDKVR